jgi:hypothetical protein
MPAPTHPTGGVMIPVIRTHPDGSTQTYWMSLKKFMEEREKGAKVARIPRQEHKSVVVPKAPAKEWEMEFIENIEDFGTAGLSLGNDKYEVELVTEARVKKNGKLIKTYPIKVNRGQVARAVINKLIEMK